MLQHYQKKQYDILRLLNIFGHTQPLFKKINLMNIEDLYSQSILKCYKMYNNYNLPHFSKYLKSIENIYQVYNLRNNHIIIPIHFHSFAEKGLFFYAF